MIDTDKYEGHTPADDWKSHLIDALFETEFPMTYADNQLMADAPKLLAEVKRLREEKDLLRSMQRDGIEASAYDNLLSEINRLREDNEKLHDAINRSFHAKFSGSAFEIYNGWWEGEEE